MVTATPSPLDALSASELKFVQMYAQRDLMNPPMPRYKCYMEAFPGSCTTGSASTLAWKLLKQQRIQDAIAELTGEVVKNTIASLEEIRENLTSVMRGAAGVLGDAVSWEMQPTDDDSDYEMVAVTDDPYSIPGEYQSLVHRYRLLDDGRYRVVFHPDALVREKLTAAATLAKMQGAFIDRVEVSGGTTNIAISAEMSSEDATQLYRNMLKGA